MELKIFKDIPVLRWHRTVFIKFQQCYAPVRLKYNPLLWLTAISCYLQMNIIMLHKHESHEIATHYYYKPLYKNELVAGFLRFDCQILDGQRVVNKLKLYRSQFFIFASTWL